LVIGGIQDAVMLLPLAWHLGFRGFMSLCFSCVLLIGASRICFSPDTWFDGSTFKRLKGVLVLHGCCVSLDMASASPKHCLGFVGWIICPFGAVSTPFGCLGDTLHESLRQQVGIACFGLASPAHLA